VPRSMTDIKPYQALGRVAFIEAVKGRAAVYLALNPAALNATGSQEVGKLYTPGYSHPTLQSAFTREITYKVDLVFSQYLYAKLGLEQFYIEEAIAWFEGAVYPEKLGQAPPILRMVWPHVRTAQVIVQGWTTQRSLFDPFLRTRIAKMTLNLIEIRKSFKTWVRHRAYEGHGAMGDEAFAQGSYVAGGTVGWVGVDTMNIPGRGKTTSVGG